VQVLRREQGLDQDARSHQGRYLRLLTASLRHESLVVRNTALGELRAFFRGNRCVTCELGEGGALWAFIRGNKLGRQSVFGPGAGNGRCAIH
jgi:hypothetical protein